MLLLGAEILVDLLHAHLAQKGEASIQIHKDSYLQDVRGSSDPHPNCLVPLNTHKPTTHRYLEIF